FEIQRPDKVLKTIIAIDIGIFTKPEVVGDMPSTPCTKNGKYIIAPIMPAFIRKPIELETVTMLFLNIDKGSTGLFAFRSRSSKIIKNRPAAQRKPIICGEAH